ncbi:MAG: CatB-related O-acetyltransferase [Synergistaceae bacterium]|nr:CatB-related O-acetyltransferase [Synergistaceae bacterium]
MVFGSVLGDYSYTGYNTIVKYAEIGKFCSISWNISIGGAHDFHALTTHPFPYAVKWGMCENDGRAGYFDEPLRIGSDVWIGSNACVLRGLVVGDGAVIGAGSVVTKDVPAYAVVVGNPARVIKYRFSDEVIARLLRLKWWELPDEILREHVSVFSGVLTEEGLGELERIRN